MKIGGIEASFSLGEKIWGHMMFTIFLKGRRLSLPAVKIARDHALARDYRAEVVLMDKKVSERFTELVGRAGFQTSNS